MNKNIIYIAMALVILWAYAYMAYGEDSLPTPKEIALEQRARLLEEQAQIDRDNLKILAYCNEYASWAKADERQKHSMIVTGHNAFQILIFQTLKLILERQQPAQWLYPNENK